MNGYKNPSRVIHYIRTTKDLPLTLEAKNSNIFKGWVGALFAIHNNMKSHSGGMIPLGKSTMYSKEYNQKLDTSISTVAELFGVDDRIPDILWSRNFLKAQSVQF